ncbi:MAG: hypothetical protein GY867_12230, partial [bacterium]|nr:hypothetical protein [bacterium]
MRINTWAGKLAVILVLACAGISPAAENDGALDTTRVRQPEKPEKSVGRVIADVPGEILKLPVRTVRFLALSVSRPPISDVAKVIKLSGPVQRYIPIVGYSSNAGLKLGFGLRQIKAKSFGDRLDFKWYYSTKDYQSYQFRFKMRELMGKRIGINFYYRYKKRPRESFYGVGMGTDEDCEANYTLESS